MARFPELFLGADSEGSLDRGGPTGFLGCVLAWGCSEMIRYAFFVGQLLRGEPFGWIKWLRYNAFLVLYPFGLVSEAWLVYLALVRGAGAGPVYRGYLFLGLLTYLPGELHGDQCLVVGSGLYFPHPEICRTRPFLPPPLPCPA